MKKQIFCFKQMLLVSLSMLSVSVFVYAGSTQNVTVKGSIDNSSSGSGKAMMNIGSAVGKSIGNNNQTVIVNGALVNKASGNGKASINIGSSVNDGGNNNQSVSIGGSIVNSASGGKSEVNIGSVVKEN
ncbi:hypothetical protein BKK56_02340 [Rodentibacter genomosp. 2]|uniref:hypothetical protein n=1 Tax=Rodentibacter genomosp. 2 TaxID=1908266 RepID=UPI000987A94D|nr:hypothetical protein BKK56_02340 [Rodentibacter genomosp. 2]